MKPGLSLTELETRFEADAKSKIDYNVAAERLTVDEKGHIVLEPKKGPTKGQTQVLTPNQNFRMQLAEFVHWPWKFYEETGSALLIAAQAAFMNALLKGHKELRMVRTQGEAVNAFLSNGYRRIDNEAVALTIFDAIPDKANWQVHSAQITEGSLYLKIMLPVTAEVRKGDVIRSGFLVQNNEWGNGSFKFSPLIERLICTNGAVMADYGMRQIHAGARFLGDGNAEALMSDRTKMLTDKALLSQVQDIVHAVSNATKFKELAAKFTDSTKREITGDDEELVTVIAQENGFTEAQRKSIWKKLLTSQHGEGMTQYGVMNAVNSAAQDEKIDYAESVRMERVAGQIVELDDKGWKSLNERKPKKVKTEAAPKKAPRKTTRRTVRR